jgi:hypothetical protein
LGSAYSCDRHQKHKQGAAQASESPQAGVFSARIGRFSVNRLSLRVSWNRRKGQKAHERPQAKGKRIHGPHAVFPLFNLVRISRHICTESGYGDCPTFANLSFIVRTRLSQKQHYDTD